ncbi:Cof-type HAD-IIB family hydrolase [Pectinatus sottacetonis]|uniref:Cof-type HAD-IIB family hydrolase n=1 Tax=Pectinatus sottacetonis TaxID=1002795 RepID=UPI0018C606F2|nr:Cof-type HAD-IIB family hydrolase [Pectinatus sottacetonis]
MIKLIAADMDGTLINRKHILSPENCAMIHAAQKHGIRFVVATGRFYKEVHTILSKYNISCECITMNGAEYYNKDGQCINGIYFSKEKAREILDFMKADGKFAIEMYTNRGCYTADSRLKFFFGFMKRAHVYHADYSLLQRIFYTLCNTHFHQIHYIKDMNDLIMQNINIAKFISYSDNPLSIHNLKEKLKIIDDIAVSGSFTTNVEINEKTATKGNILHKIAEQDNIQENEVMVIGDGLNDLSMFQEFPTNSAAMGNAAPEVKNIASFITTDCDHSGVAKAINNVLTC